MKIVIDGMGGDNAPMAPVEGACMAVKEYGIDIVITGDKGLLEAELAKYDCDKTKIEIRRLMPWYQLAAQGPF